MKTLLNYSAIVLVMIALLGGSTLHAQEWTKEQTAVWQEIENMWTLWQNNDIEAAFANVHEKYLGWNNSSPMPMTKAKWVDPMIKSKDLYSKKTFNIERARILVHGNVAIVHYYYEMSFLFNDGVEKDKLAYHGKWANFFVKEDGKWMLIGDFTFDEPNK